jgi:hypothetical protein
MVRKKEAIILQVVKIICNMHPLTECQLKTYNVKTIEVYHNATLFAGVENTNTPQFISGINASEEIYMGISITFKRDKKSLFALANRNFIL